MQNSEDGGQGAAVSTLASSLPAFQRPNVPAS